MSSTEALKVFLGVLGVIVGLPTVIVMVRAGMFFGSLSKAVAGLEKSLSEATEHVGSILERLVEDVADHEVRIRLAEQFMDARKVELGWTPDRRHGERRKSGDEE